jgi:hypothetical protein
MVMKLHAQDIQKHRWENRILIVTTTNETFEKLNLQLEVFKNNKDELHERKLLVYKIVENQFEFIDFIHSKVKDSGTISDGFRDKYLENYEGFKVILIGLDGSIKLEQYEILSIDNLLSTIDAMPMRRNEIRRNK